MKDQKILKKGELKKALKTLPNWNLNPKETALVFTATFKDHVDALVFIARATVNAQVLGHHPEIVFTYKKVKVTLTTKDVKGITKKDIELAHRLSAVRKSG